MHQEMFRQIQRISEKRGETLSETIRELISQGLTDKIYSENTQLLAQVVREQMELVLRSFSVKPVFVEPGQAERNVVGLGRFGKSVVGLVDDRLRLHKSPSASDNGKAS